MTYPDTIDKLFPPSTSKREQNVAIRSLEKRIGTLNDGDPASVEDRLYTLENLMVDVLARLDQPPGQVRK